MSIVYSIVQYSGMQPPVELSGTIPEPLPVYIESFMTVTSILSVVNKIQILLQTQVTKKLKAVRTSQAVTVARSQYGATHCPHVK